MCRKWGTPKNFCLAFIDELEKQQLKKKGGPRKCKNFNINVALIFLNRKTHFEI